MATAAQWIQGARPRTLPAAIAPVSVGTGVAIAADSLHVWRALLALVVAVALQIAVNFANDYSDGIRGTDEQRVGPVRLVGQRLASPRSVKLAALASFAAAGIAGTILILHTQAWWLFLVGAASIAAGWFYTGGKRPYGYLGLGEIFVFVFFGLVPVMGTAYVQTLSLTVPSLIAGIGVGSLACSILITNNLRDIPTDTEHHKRTLAVRLGDHRTRKFFAGSVALAFIAVAVLALVLGPTVFLGFLAAPFAVSPLRIVASGATGPALIPALKATGVLLLIYGLTLGSGIALTG